MLRSASEEQWLRDLGSLLRDAKGRFADVCWEDEGSGRVVYAHKALVYARATGSFQQRYLGVPHSLSEADLSQYGPSTTSLRTFTPSSVVRRDSAQSAASAFDSTARLWTPDSARNGSTEDPVGKPRSLGHTDVGVFETALEYLYTASGDTEAFATVLDGFQDATDDDDKSTGVQRLRQDLLYCWRSKLYSDISIALDDSSSEPFAAHRAVLVSRSPYFSSLLLGEFRDSSAHTVTLPSPPFTAASLTFILGYIYSGTLDFSPRKFDLATTFEIWRGAAFLAMDGLQSDIEDRILDMLTPQRAARILDFAHSPDVSSERLIAAAAPLVAEHFHEAWCATPHVGNLPYEAQKALVRRVCDAVSPAKLAHVATRLSKARRRLEPERAPWAEHVRSMLDAVEETLVRVLGRDLPGVVASDGFVDLINGVGFSCDVLEWLLSLVVKGLTEASAPRAYQALVGTVLLREEGIFADARVLVDDARAGVLGYIKRKWLNIRDAGGFSGVDAWCLQELADEIEVPVADLRIGPSALQYSPAKAASSSTAVDRVDLFARCT
ncbi:uncharacterized protein JCM10292_006766 [Rhodotorula paludigena]|uniref:uncharacterized protein n=1 Tax=Rhodotorula paludigena TaxID=86838 RepID=UPI003170702B